MIETRQITEWLSWRRQDVIASAFFTFVYIFILAIHGLP